MKYKIVKLKVNFQDLFVKIPKQNTIKENNKWKYAFLNQNLIHNDGPMSYKTNVIALKFIYSEGEKMGFLQAYFDKSWCLRTNGLIYNNPHWIKDLRKEISNLLKIKINSTDITYSEQGMQGNNYVHMDISNKIIKQLSKS